MRKPAVDEGNASKGHRACGNGAGSSNEPVVRTDFAMGRLRHKCEGRQIAPVGTNPKTGETQNAGQGPTTRCIITSGCPGRSHRGDPGHFGGAGHFGDPERRVLVGGTSCQLRLHRTVCRRTRLPVSLPDRSCSDAAAAKQEETLGTRRTSWSAAGCNRPALRTWSKPP
jgi:hypothetical protein